MAGRPSTHAYRATVPTRSHTSRVVEDLGLAIISGKHPEGSLLPGDGELIERYGVSRTVVREALKTLSAKGLLQAKARIGTRVQEREHWNLFDPDVLIWHARIGFSTEFIRHLGEMRLALEPEAAALAAVRRTPEQLDLIREWARRMGDPNDFVEADLHFHLAVAAAAGNPFFISISTLIEVALIAMLSGSSPVPAGRLATSISEHRQVLAAIEARDAEQARTTMKQVVQAGILYSESAVTHG